jgi:hypothetical protein
MQGAFEVVGCGGGRSGRCVRQMTPREPILWRPASDNYALLGDPSWANYTVSTDVMLEQSAYVLLAGHAGWQSPPGVDAYYLIVGDDGQWSVRRNDVTNPLVSIASGRVAALGTNRWHNVSLTFSGTRLTAKIDGATVASLDDLYWVAGQVGIGTSKGALAQFDNLSITPESGPAPPRAGQLMNPVSGRCLDVKGESEVDGTVIVLWECDGHLNQQLIQGPGGTLQLYGRTKCLDVLGHATAPGAVVGIWGCNGGPNQQWVFNANGTVTGVQSGLCLDIVGAGTQNNAEIALWTCHGGGNQQWRL